MSSERRVAIVGCGLIGSAWAIVFARAGWNVRLFDVEQSKIPVSISWIGSRLADLVEFGLVEASEAVAARIEPCARLEDAVKGADYVQESVLERTDVKREVFSHLETVIDAKTLVGSSSSGIPASEYTGHVAFRERCLVAHPINPPYLIPLVELVPGPWTDRSTTIAVRQMMAEIGQKPIVLTREMDGFVLNRLQGVLLMECWKLAEEGIASVADIDATVSHGLGLRWSFMGPFETIDLNAPGGISDYANRLGGLYQSIAGSRATHDVWSPNLIEMVEAQRRQLLPEGALGERSAWRDRRLMSLTRHKETDAVEFPDKR
jgi:3-hydroxyacyl-CoA dehydrogenase